MNKITMNKITALVLVLATAGVASGPALAQSEPADNTRSNQTDASNRTITADSQKENATDRALVRRIRKSIIADKGLSTYAHNVKIVAVNGQVTLNGVVRSDDEKSKVGEMAQQAAGTQNVVNDLKVASPSS